MEAEFCIEALQEALAKHGKPEIFNSDQGSQFTSADFTSVLLKNGIAISMDGKGSWRDNVFIERLWRRSNGKRWCAVETCFAVGQVSFIGDGGRSSEDGLQGQSSNHHKLRG